ncbi:MAG: extracellular solute-binding protein [Armatimonadetes bacterium]|nr:extracellular solute-binding protein [Armatimonadota bacterium]
MAGFNRLGKGALLILSAIALVGCGKSGSEATTDPVAPKPAGWVNDKAGPKLEVASFQGGYGIDFFQKAGEEYAKKNGTEVKVWGDPNIWKQLQPRFVSGDVPDLTWPGWGMDYWKLVKEGQIRELNEALETPGPDGKGKWRDSFEPGLLALGTENGKTYMLPYHFNINGWWYNKTLFVKNGWTAPATYEELLTLGEKMKAKGVAPLTFQGQYPYYSIFGLLLPWTISSGGIKALDDMQNLVPGAWKSEAVVKAATMIEELRTKGFFEKGAVGMSHTESQTQFLLGKAGMIPCGTWLFSEMQQVWPTGVEAEFMLPPAPAAGQDNGNVCVGIEPWIIPTKAKNPVGAMEFYKYMTSLDQATKFVEEKGTLMSIKGANEKAKLPPHLVMPAKLFGASKTVWAPQFSIWYPKFKKEIENALASLMNGESNPGDFAQRCEEAADECRNDTKITKHTYAR